MGDSLNVFHDGHRVGTLTRDHHGRLGFTYHPSWLERPEAFPISVSLPLGGPPRGEGAGHAFFANLLPEGNLREAVARRLGLSPDNDFALLEALGGECAGALTLVPAGAHPSDSPGGYEPLDPAHLAALARRQAVLAELTHQARPRLSLAGAQDKLPVRIREDGSLWLPVGAAPSTHILKVPSRDYRHLPANEVLTTHLAAALGLRVVETRLLRLQDVDCAVVRRYDRLESDAGIRRLHQEDLCQALGLPPTRKYEQEGGPSIRDAMTVVRKASADPLPDAMQLLRWLVLSLLLGNSDAHGKNLSLVHAGSPMAPRLAPFYDLVCSRVYPRLDRHLAMGIGGTRDPGQVARSHWEVLAEELGVGKRFVIGLVTELLDGLPEALDRVTEEHRGRYGETPVAERLRRVVTEQRRRSRHLL